MKKLFLLALALVLWAGMVQASVNITSGDNVVILGPHMGPQGNTAPVEVIRVTLGTNASAAVGDVMVWDVSNDNGIAVRPSLWDQGQRSATGPGVADVFAGVMMTTTSKQSAGLATKLGGPNSGYMAIRGFCAAKVDTTESGTGEALCLNGYTLSKSFQTDATGASSRTSQDIGILLKDTGVDGLMNVWLK